MALAAWPNRTGDSVATTDDLNSKRFYHGTKANLVRGDLIEPGYYSNYGTRKKAAYDLASTNDNAISG